MRKALRLKKEIKEPKEFMFDGKMWKFEPGKPVILDLSAHDFIYGKYRDLLDEINVEIKEIITVKEPSEKKIDINKI